MLLFEEKKGQGFDRRERKKNIMKFGL